MGTRFLLTNPFPSSITINPTPHLSTDPNLWFPLRCFQARSRRWDSNAETTRSQSFNFTSPDDGDSDGDFVGFRGQKPKRRRWWSDDSSEDDDDGGILEEVIDSVWLFKAFRSFGWFLPAVILSFLLATGPKAFLMALAFPLGQSAISLAFKKLWGMTQNNSPKRKSRSKRKPFSSTSTNVEMEEEAESEEPRMGKMGYRSWVVGNDGSVDNGVRDGPGFGGWDDLDRRRETNMGSLRPDRTKSGSRRTPTEKGKLSRRERKRDTPLFLRLLIAVFPFLGSWTKLL